MILFKRERIVALVLALWLVLNLLYMIIDRGGAVYLIVALVPNVGFWAAILLSQKKRK
jgi:membrane associated rhomboid family serine protease